MPIVNCRTLAFVGWFERAKKARGVSLELSAVPHIKVGAELPVRVDPGDRSKVLVVAPL
jgi:hypothetical protein